MSSCIAVSSTQRAIDSKHNAPTLCSHGGNIIYLRSYCHCMDSCYDPTTINMSPCNTIFDSNKRSRSLSCDLGRFIVPVASIFSTMKIFEREISPNDEPSSIDNILSPPTGKSSTAPQPQPEPQPQPPQVNKNTRPASEKSPSGFIASIPFVVMVTIITGAVLAPTKAAAVFLCLSMLWVAFLIYDAHVKNIGLSKPRQLGLLCHAIPAIFFLLTTKTAESSQDTALVWFMALILFRYWRIMVNIYFWFQYKPAVIIPGLKQVNASDCTVVVPTVGPGEGEK
jgi:hypothetical protein